MTIKDEILAIANQLANHGQKPTVALVKTKLSQNVPLPQIISTLKHWQHQPEFTQVSNNQTKVTEQPTGYEVKEQALKLAIEQAISPLRSEIADLKRLIEQLLASKS